MGKGLEPFVQPLAHFAGGFLGEGDRQDLVRQDLLPGCSRGPVKQRPHDARDQHPGLAGTGAGFHRHAAPRVAGDGVERIGGDRRAVALVGGGVGNQRWG